MIRRIFLLLSFVFSVTAVFSQQGTIRGNVIDNENGETLIGASVIIDGTTTGTITDFDGNYSLNLSPGTYTINISYISYETKQYTDIVIEAGEVTELNAQLGEAQLEINAVVVTAEARQKTEAALQVVQRKSANVMDGISAEQISKLGDSDAASALKRVTGVSVQGGKYVFVRGLSDRYTKITLNGADIPALDPEKNTVQMDIFPSNIIENIIVHKTFTPNLPGESTGGHVDIVTKDFPSKFTFMFSTGFGYNPQSNLNSDFLTYEGGSTDWLGMDDGTRKIPDLAQRYQNTYSEVVYPTNLSLNDAEAINNSFNKEFVPTRKQSFLDHNHKLSIGNQVPFLGKTLGFNASLSYDRSFEYFENGTIGLYEESNTPSPWKIYGDTETDKYPGVESGSEKVNISGLVNANIKLNHNNKVGVRYIGNQSGLKYASIRQGYFYYEAQKDIDRNLGWLERTMHSGQLHGKHVVPAANKMIVEWLGSASFMSQNEPDLRFFENLWIDDSTMRIKTNDKPVRFYRLMEETDYSGKLDITLPLELFKATKIKFGGSYSGKFRTLDNVKWESFNTDSEFPITTVEDYLNDYAISQDYLGYYYRTGNSENNGLSYHGKQSSFASYLMGDFTLFNKLRLIAGARIESSYMEIENEIDTTKYSINSYKYGELKEIDVLPSLAITYRVIEESMNIRLAYGKTLARPTFREYGTNYYDYKTGLFINGNQELNRALIDNIDFRWEWFFARGEKVAVSGFYKYFQEPIELQLNPRTQNFEIQYINSDDAYLYGVEIEFRKKLNVIPAFEHLYAGGNFTFVESVVQIPDSTLAKIRVGDPDRGETREMLGQAPYIINGYLSYDNPEIKFGANLAFNTSGEKLLIVTQGSTPYIYEQPMPSLNFNISKGFRENLSVEFSIKNILDSEYRAVHHYEKDYDYLRYSRGRTFGLSFKYQIN